MTSAQTTQPPVAKRPKRVFKMGATNLTDPHPDMTLKEVQDLYANTYSMLKTATMKEGVLSDDGEQIVYEFERPRVQTKGRTGGR